MKTFTLRSGVLIQLAVICSKNLQFLGRGLLRLIFWCFLDEFRILRDVFRSQNYCQAVLQRRVRLLLEEPLFVLLVFF